MDEAVDAVDEAVDEYHCPLKSNCRRRRAHVGVCMSRLDGEWEIMPVPPLPPRFADWREAAAMLELVKLAYGPNALV